MTTYIAILRGINVSGHRTIKMADLKVMCGDLGLHNIQTYIQSGNIVFQTTQPDPQDLEKQIKHAISEKFGLDVPVMVRTHSDLKKVISMNPFIKDKTKDAAHLHITFLSGKPQRNGDDQIDAGKFRPDEFCIMDQVIYLYCPNGYGNSKLTNGYFESKLKVTATTRNWKTTNALYVMADSISVNE